MGFASARRPVDLRVRGPLSPRKVVSLPQCGEMWSKVPCQRISLFRAADLWPIGLSMAQSAPSIWVLASHWVRVNKSSGVKASLARRWARRASCTVVFQDRAAKSKDRRKTTAWVYRLAISQMGTCDVCDPAMYCYPLM